MMVELEAVEVLNIEVCIKRRVQELWDLKKEHPNMQAVCDEMLSYYEPLLVKLEEIVGRM